MPVVYEPLQQVRKDFQLRWYRCPIEPARLRELTARSDLEGFLQTIGHLLIVCVTGAATWLFFSHGIWIGFALALFVHGTIYSFLSSGNHELSHGTVFKTKWLNTMFLYLFGLLTWFNPRDFKLSHTYHHLYTLHPRGDREVVLPTTPSVHPLMLLQLLTLNLVGGRNEPYSFPIAQNVGATLKLAFLGRHSSKWLTAVYEGQVADLKRAINWARFLLLFHAALVAVSIILRLWPLPLIVTAAPFIANWWRYLVFVPMHTGLKDNVSDFRLCTRSITLDPFSHFIYWRMNWHTEHHMFAAVPCYRLRELYKTVAADMPRPRTVLGAWREIRMIWREQKTNPDYQFITPLPGHKDGKPGNGDALASAIGDLPPKDFR
jgi:fatty acid desaturase